MKNYYEYLEFNGASLFTVICLPEESGKFPIVIRRDPYVDAVEDSAEDEIVDTPANTTIENNTTGMTRYLAKQQEAGSLFNNSIRNGTKTPSKAK